MEQEKIWDHYQAGGEATDLAFQGARARHEYIVDLIPSGSVVLNIGVGDGGLERKLIDRGCVPYSLDPSEASIVRLRERFGMGERAQVGYSQSIPMEDGFFDVVVMSEVIEHLETEVLEASLADVARVLKRSGRFIGTTPAEEDLRVSDCLCPSCGTNFHRWGHVQSFDETRLRQLLSVEFRSLDISRHYFSSGSENWRGKLFGIAKTLQLRAGRTGSNETFVFYGRPFAVRP